MISKDKRHRPLRVARGVKESDVPIAKRDAVHSCEVNLWLGRLGDLAAAKHVRLQERAASRGRALEGKNIALIFEKSSTRTRCAFESAAFDQGAFVTYLGPSGSQIGDKESMKDTARVLGRMYDAIEYRGFGQEVVETLSRYSGVPVWNSLTNEFHPTQILADLLMTEVLG